MISLACASCGKTLQVNDDLKGKKMQCPVCGQGLSIPATAGERDSTLHIVWDDSGVTNRPTLVPMEPAQTPSAERKQQMGQIDTQSYEKTGVETYANAKPGTELTDFLAAPQAPDEIGRLGGYRVLQVLGHGGMGVVFRAEDPQLGRVVALKAMLPALAASGTSRQRFLREARAAAAVKHDHVVTIFQVSEDRGVPFLAMEFLEGESLDDRLKRQGRLPLPQALRIAREIATGLAAAHKRGLIHRDVKPGNVWLEGENGRVKLLDFGLARLSGDDTHLTQQGAIVGTPAFMAPEQATCKPVDHRCDLFSLGGVLYQMCTGAPAFQGKDTISTLMAVATEKAVPPRQRNPQVPPELNELILRLLAKDPNDRPASAGEVIAALEAIESGRLVPPPGSKAPRTMADPSAPTLIADGPPETTSRWRVWLPMVGVAVILAGLLAVLGIWLGGKHGEGTVRLDTAIPDIEVVVKSDDQEHILGKEEIALPVGFYEVELRGAREELDVEPWQFELKRGKTKVVTVTRAPDRGPAQLPVQGPLPEGPLYQEAKIQGEYEGKMTGGGKVGCQVIALGKGAFQAVVLPGGLPGQGWDEKHKILMDGRLEGDRAVFKPAWGDKRYLAPLAQQFSATLRFPPVGQKQYSGLIANDTLTVETDQGTAFALTRVVRRGPTLGAKAPADAVVLFNGTNLEHWSGGRLDRSTRTLHTDGNDLWTEGKLSSYTAHVEFLLPFVPEARGQGRGNSGWYHVDQYEMQILDSFGLEGRDDECGSVFKKKKPGLNMCLPPLVWQTFDMEFTNAVVANRKKISNARTTLKHNGVVVLDNVEITGPTFGGRTEPEGTPGPIRLQGHGSPMQFRNIWLVEKK